MAEGGASAPPFPEPEIDVQSETEVQPALLLSQPLPRQIRDVFTPPRRFSKPDAHEARCGSITTNETEDNEKRIRRTTREIKRPKFDDELVDSGIGLHSKRRLSDRPFSTMSTPGWHPPPPDPFPDPYAPKPGDPIYPRTRLPVTFPGYEGGNVLDSPVPIPEPPINWSDKGDPADSSKRHDLRQRTNMISVKDRMAMDEAIQEEEAARLEKKRREAKVASKDIRAKEIAAATEAAEVPSTDLGTWTPEDDVALVTAITHVPDVAAVHRGILFSKEFTSDEISERWYRMMYDETFARQAKKRMSELPNLEILRVQSRTIFSAREEEVLRCVPVSNEHDMAQLLKEYPQDFHSARTPQVLLDHWHLMRMAALLSPAAPPMPVRNFPEWERLERNTTLTGANATTTENNLMLSHEGLERVQNWVAKVRVDEVAGIVNDSHLPEGTVATLRGCVVRYVLAKPGPGGLVLGRSTAEGHVDIDLSLEGPASRVARRQATITQDTTGEFWLKNEGKRAVMVEGKPVLQDQRVSLTDRTVIEIACLRLLFLVVRH